MEPLPPGGKVFRGPHGGKVFACDDYEPLKAELDPSRVALVMLTTRIGVRSFITFLEHTYFRPSTPMNKHFRFAIVTWQEMKWFVVIIHKKHLEKADELAKLLGLRRADGVPTVIQASDEEDVVEGQILSAVRRKETMSVAMKTFGREMPGLTVERFPLDAPNVWTMENVEGHFTYGNDKELEAKARAFEDLACDQLIEEHKRRYKAGEFAHEPGTMPPKRI